MNLKKYIKRKDLTPEQYRMANKTMSVILAICYILYILVELMHINGVHGYIRIAVYLIFAIAGRIAVKKKGDQKWTMLFMADTFLIAYILLVMNNGVVCMVMSFPALIGFMLYMNSVLIGCGCVATYIVGSVKCFMVWSNGDRTGFQ